MDDDEKLERSIEAMRRTSAVFADACRRMSSTFVVASMALHEMAQRELAKQPGPPRPTASGEIAECAVERAMRR